MADAVKPAAPAAPVAPAAAPAAAPVAPAAPAKPAAPVAPVAAAPVAPASPSEDPNKLLREAAHQLRLHGSLQSHGLAERIEAFLGPEVKPAAPVAK